jgi:RNA recognition motif-containing protein
VTDLSFDAGPRQLKDFFSQCGEVTFVKLLKRPDGKSKGKCFVKFSDARAVEKAMDLNGQNFMGRRIVVEMPKNESEFRERQTDRQGDRPSDRSRDHPRDQGYNRTEQPRRTGDEQSVVVKNLPFKMDEQSLGEFFEDCGDILRVKILKDREGRSKGLGFVDFSNQASLEKAIRKNGESL